MDRLEAIKFLLGKEEIEKYNPELYETNVFFIASDVNEKKFTTNLNIYLNEYDGKLFKFDNLNRDPWLYRGRRFNCVAINFSKVKKDSQSEIIYTISAIVPTILFSKSPIPCICFYCYEKNRDDISKSKTFLLPSLFDFINLIVDDNEE